MRDRRAMRSASSIGVALASLVACSSTPPPDTVSGARIEAATPPPESRCQGPACQSACDGGDGAACSRLADASYARDRGAARRLYQRACDASEPVGCTRLLEEAGADLAAAERYARRACAAGGRESCEFLSEWTMLAFAAPRRGEDKDALFALAEQASTRSCDLGGFRSCLNAVSLLRHRKAGREAIAPVAARALALAEADCEADKIGACSFVADWAARAGDRPKALEYLIRQCVNERRLDIVVVGAEGRETPAASGQPASCRGVTELGGVVPAETTGKPTRDTSRERSVPQRALEARRTSGKTQVMPGESEADAMRAGKRALVTSVFKVCISPRGGITAIHVLAASPFPGWNRRLFEAIRSWRYSPFTVDGEPVGVCTSVTFAYKPRR
jgi:hypothetical protein